MAAGAPAGSPSASVELPDRVAVDVGVCRQLSARRSAVPGATARRTGGGAGGGAIIIMDNGHHKSKHGVTSRISGVMRRDVCRHGKAYDFTPA